jgi:hypothetical protein
MEKRSMAGLPMPKETNDATHTRPHSCCHLQGHTLENKNCQPVLLLLLLPPSPQDLTT